MLSNAWAGLTQPQRDAWAQYAKNVPLINTLGDSIKVTALNMFIRGNSPRIQAGLPIVEDGPTIFNLGETPMIESAEGTVGGLAPQIQVDLEAGDAADNWLLYLGKPVSPTINFFRGPFRFTTTDVATAANLSIAAADYPFPYAAGQKVVARVVRSSGDGRLSAEAQATFLLTVGT